MGDTPSTQSPSREGPTDQQLDEALRLAQKSLDTELTALRRQIGRGSEQTLAMRIKV